jgi:hypothetical protein
VLIRPGDPYPHKDRPPIKRDSPTLLETIEVVIGFFIMIGEVTSGCIVFLAGLFGCAVSGTVLAVALFVIVVILVVLLGGP